MKYSVVPIEKSFFQLPLYNLDVIYTLYTLTIYTVIVSWTASAISTRKSSFY